MLENAHEMSSNKQLIFLMILYTAEEHIIVMLSE